jgi:hypothetical protein
MYLFLSKTYSTLRSFIVFVILSTKYKNVEREKTKGDCLIIANGPSSNNLLNFKLNTQDLDIFAVNNFLICDSDLKKHVRPDYYVFSDPAHLEEAYFSKVVSHSSIKNLYIPFRFGQPKRQLKCVYFNDYYSFCGSTKNINLGNNFDSMTAFKAIKIALSRNYRNIYIIGFDFDFHEKILVDKENNATFLNKHFYNPSGVYCDFLINNRKLRIAEILLELGKNLKSFYTFSKHENILNLDVNSNTDLFKKIDFSEIGHFSRDYGN